jgi:hypothetical protein
MLDHCSHARFALKREAVEELARSGQGTAGAQNRLFKEDNVPEVAGKNGGQCRARTCDLLLVRQAL